MPHPVVEVLSILTGTQAKELQYQVVGSVTEERIEKRASTDKKGGGVNNSRMLCAIVSIKEITLRPTSCLLREPLK